MPNWVTFVQALPVQGTVGGSEEIPVDDASTGKTITPSALVTYVNAQQQAATTVTPTATDELQGASSAGVQETYTVASISTKVQADLVGFTPTTPVAGDWVIFDDAGTLSKGLVSDITALAVTDALDFTTLTESTPVAGDLFVYENAGVGESIALSDLEALFYADFDTYVTNTLTILADGDVAATDELWIYDADAGAPKSVTADALKTYCATAANPGNVIAPGSTTTGNIPQWGATNTLTNTLSVTTTVAASGSDLIIPTEKAVRDAIAASTVDIAGTTAITPTILSADEIMVYDASLTANASATFTQVWAWIQTQIEAAPNKNLPVDADKIMIQDSAASDVLSEVTCLNLKEYMGISDLETTEGAGITSIAESFVSGVEKVGTMHRTTIVIDLTGLDSSASGEIIGDSGTGAAHLGQITTATNGTIFAGKIECVETPATGEADIRLYSATVATGVEGDTIAGLTETELSAGGGLAAGAFESLTLPSGSPPSGDYLYLVSNGAAAGTYTAGKICITLWGK